MRGKPIKKLAALWALLLAVLGFGAYELQQLRQAPPDVVQLVRVSDGDTIVVKDSQQRHFKVRMIGVDAPELGTAASFRSALFAAELCEAAREIRIEPEPTRPADKYGRTLGWVWLTTRDGKKLLLNEQMIARGNAQLFEGTSRSVKYYERLR
jgi:micrococcal nuclease